MSPKTKKEYLATIYPRYKKASKKQKRAILDEFCHNCGYNRKHAIRLLNNYKRFIKPKPGKRGRPSEYDKPEIIEVLEEKQQDALRNLFIYNRL